jgi:hypothetical protein
MWLDTICSTMLFILTSAEDATASFLVDILAQKHVKFLRLDSDTLVSRSSLSYHPRQPALKVDGTWYEPSDVTHVWYRRPQKLRSPALEGSPEGKYTLEEWAASIEGFFAHVPMPKWMNHPASNALASHKLGQLSTACNLGLKIPDTLVTQDADALKHFFSHHNGCIIVKPMATGYVERPADSQDSLIYTNRILQQHLANLSDLTSCPTMFQQFINKQYDVRITVIDANLHAVALTALDKDGEQRCDIRRDNMRDVRYQQIELPQEVSTQIQRLVKKYELRFAAIDMVVDLGGDWYFLEINPNGQWAWMEICANIKLSESFLDSFH